MAERVGFEPTNTREDVTGIPGVGTDAAADADLSEDNGLATIWFVQSDAQ